MAINLNRKQLIETLREMGVVFPPNAGREELKAILEEAYQRQWLKTAQAQATARRGQVIRRRKDLKERNADEAAAATPAGNPAGKLPSRTPVVKITVPPEAELPPRRNFHPTPKERVSASIHDRTQNLEATALKRAGGLCELCEQRPKAGRGGAPGELKTCHFMDPPEGVPRTAKTVAALCPDCYERVTQAPALADLKLLKRKARRKGTDGVAVTSKAKPSPPPKAQRATQRPPQGLPRKAHRRPR